MLHFDSAPLRVLYLGGTGTISASCVRLSVASGMEVSVLNRGFKDAPSGTESLIADVTDEAALAAVLQDRTFDAVVNFLSFDADDARRKAAFFGPRARQYVHISSASIYSKPVRQVPITESTPTGPNPALPYATAKWEAERALRDFPATIVRPSHTYDATKTVLSGGWTSLARMLAGKPVIVHGDGTSLWTVTHHDDFARAFVPLLGHPRTYGEAFQITSDDVLTWDQIARALAAALGVTARIVHVPSDVIAAADPEWGAGLLGDKAHSMVFDNSKLRSVVPGWRATIPFERGAREIADWYLADPARQVVNDKLDALMDKLAADFSG